VTAEDGQAAASQGPAELPPQRGRLTVVGVLVLVSVLGTLASLLALWVFQVRRTARRPYCSNHLHQLGMAMSSYAGDYDECFPCIRNDSMTRPMVPGDGTKSLALLYPDYVDNAKTFTCHSKMSNYKNFELKGFAALSNRDPRLKWSTSYWYDYRHHDGQLSTIVVAGDAAADTGWRRKDSASYYRPVSHNGQGCNLLFIGARVQWVGCMPTGTKMSGDTATDPNVYTRDTSQAQHDTCLVN
jgi:hypothetical protein